MEHFAFIATACTCAIVAFFTWCDSKKHEEETGVEERIVRAIQTYVDNSIQHFKQEIVRDHLKKQEHLAQCLLFRTVHVAEEIQGISLSCGSVNIYLHLNDLNVFGWNGQKVAFKNVNIQIHPTMNTYCIHVGRPMDIEFEFPVGVQYIDFDIRTLENGPAHVEFFTTDKTVLCTTTISMKKHKIYNTAFLCTL